MTADRISPAASVEESPSLRALPTDEPSARPARRAHGTPQAPVVPSAGRLRPLGLSEVRITGGFWGRRQAVNADATLPHIEHWLERAGWLDNFDLAAEGGSMAGRRGREFSDSEVYKLLEAMAWELGRRPDADLAERFHAIVSRVAAAQDDDGYLDTNFGGDGQQPRYSDLEWGHELYCQGHLMQAAVARVRTGHPDDLLVRVARRSADHICSVFGDGGLEGICGHPEVEVGLAELGRALAEPRYLQQAGLFLERRGHGTLADIEFGRAYYQDDVPIRDARVFRGHAVRANYLAAGALDHAVETGDMELVDVVAGQWERTVSRRTYLTGGQGSRHQDEGFGDDFMLPPDRAYSETCAAIASVMVAWRLLLQTGEVRYADLVERTLYNVVATSPSQDGTSFFYANTLHQRSPGEPPALDAASARAESSMRAPWFDVSCCPPNVARTLASLAAYCATTDATGVQIHQYAPMTLRPQFGAGQSLVLEVETDYPRSGRVVVRAIAGEVPEWELSLRVPAWSSAARLVDVDGRTSEVAPGTVRVPGPRRLGQEVVLELDLTPRFVVADERVDAVRGCVAVQRGPEVWCLESVDVPTADPEADLERLRVDTSIAPEVDSGRLRVRGRLAPTRGPDGAWPYRPLAPASEAAQDPSEPLDVALVPYHDWASRGPSTMRVWIPVA